MTRIEQIIAEIEEYIENCKYQPLSNSKIVVNRDDLDELVEDLRQCLPDEIKKYQRIIANRDAILEDAQGKADDTIKKADERAAELVSESEVMQKARQEADKTISEADGQGARIIADAKEEGNRIIAEMTVKADALLSKANADANAVRNDASAYTEESLGMIQSLLSSSIDALASSYNTVLGALQTNLDVATQNRIALRTIQENQPASAEEAAPEPETYNSYVNVVEEDLGYDRNSTLEEAYAASQMYEDTQEITNKDM